MYPFICLISTNKMRHASTTLALGWTICTCHFCRSKTIEYWKVHKIRVLCELTVLKTNE